MKKLIFSAAALLVLAGSSASAITLNTTQIAGVNKPKPAPTQPGPDTDKIPPMCPLSDPNGCGILD